MFMKFIKTFESFVESNIPEPREGSQGPVREIPRLPQFIYDNFDEEDIYTDVDKAIDRLKELIDQEEKAGLQFEDKDSIISDARDFFNEDLEDLGYLTIEDIIYHLTTYIPED